MRDLKLDKGGMKQKLAHVIYLFEGSPKVLVQYREFRQ